MQKYFFIAAIILFITNSTFSQFTEFHPELNWFTIKGEHAEVHYHEGADRTAKVISKIIEEVWGPITFLYNYEPGTVHFVIKDMDDYSNGATYFFDNKIEIWTSALDFDLRGQHNWLRNVISHEFTHLVQIQAAMKVGRGVPAFFLQMLNYEDERRPDILYGFPNTIISYPLASINMPAWFAEGTAQYMRKDFDYDNWDSHRDMILRSYVLDEKMLTWNEMGVFGKTSLGNESVYNSGFALTKYIAQKYGEDKLMEITNALGEFGNFTIDAAFSDVLGKDGNEIYTEWKIFLIENYKERTEDLRSNLVEGELIAKDGFGNFYPQYSSDGKQVIYISNKSSDYFSPAGIYQFDLETKEEKLLVGGVRSTFSMIPGTNKILYAKLSDDNKNWYNVHDLYIYDVDEEDDVRLTNNLRANQPNLSHDGEKIVFLYQKDGTSNLGVVDIDGSNFKSLTFFQNGEQVFNPKFSNDDSFIIFDYADHQSRDIYKVSVSGGSAEPVINTKHDERNPIFNNDGKLIFASDETGIYNLYSLDMNSGEKRQLTNVLGGAFMPAEDLNGNILYAGYTSSGYKIFQLTNPEKQKVVEGKNYVRVDNPPLNFDKPKGDISNYDINLLRNFEDKDLDEINSEKYSGRFSKLTFYPFIRFDNYNTSNNFFEKLKPGLYVSSNDMLNRYSIFAGVSINSKLERDLFLIFDYRNKLPLFFDLGLKPELALELYNISRKANVDIYFGADTVGSLINYDYIIPDDVTYNLFEVDVAAKHKIFSREQDLEFRFVFSRYSASLGSFILPDNTLYPTTNDTYLIGRNFRLTYSYQGIVPDRDDEINPVGAKLEVKYDYESNKFNEDGDYVVEDGLLKPKYKLFSFHKVELNSKIHIGLWSDHTLTAQVRAGTIFGPKVPDFFDFYLGGLIGMKAYPFYAISGNEIGWINLTYRFPLFRNIDARFGHLYLDKIFLAFYGDFGNAWNGDKVNLKDFKKGAGAELRVHLNSFYLFPTDVFVNASYGFDKFSRTVRNEVVTYGEEWRLYGGILFGFDF